MPITNSGYAIAETLDFPEAITPRILLTGKQTDGAQEVFVDIDGVLHEIALR